MLELVTKPLFLVPACALAYAAATLGMKWTSSGHGLFAIALIVACLAVAVGIEIVLLQRVKLGLVYVGILVAETVLILGLAAPLGEGLTPKELAGAGLVLVGAGIITL